MRALPSLRCWAATWRNGEISSTSIWCFLKSTSSPYRRFFLPLLLCFAVRCWSFCSRKSIEHHVLQFLWLSKWMLLHVDLHKPKRQQWMWNRWGFWALQMAVFFRVMFWLWQQRGSSSNASRELEHLNRDMIRGVPFSGEGAGHQPTAIEQQRQQQQQLLIGDDSSSSYQHYQSEESPGFQDDEEPMATSDSNITGIAPAEHQRQKRCCHHYALVDVLAVSGCVFNMATKVSSNNSRESWIKSYRE